MACRCLDVAIYKLSSRLLTCRHSFHCFFCHGYEERGVYSAGALATGLVTAPDLLTIMSLSVQRLSQRVVVYTNGNTELATLSKLITRGNKITYDDRKISKFQLENNGPGVIITFADGTSKTEGFIASQPRVEQRGAELLTQLGLDMTTEGDIMVTSPFNETSVSGCFAAGDAASSKKTVMQALHMGTFAGAGLALQSMQELNANDEAM